MLALYVKCILTFESNNFRFFNTKLNNLFYTKLANIIRSNFDVNTDL